MNYCFACGKWRKLVAWFRCQECYDKWMEGK